MSTTHPIFHDLIAACQEAGCPACRLVHKEVASALDHWFYEAVLDPPARGEIRREMGFCHEHAWLTAEQGLSDALGIAIVYHDLLGEALRRLPGGGEPSAGRGMRERLTAWVLSFRKRQSGRGVVASGCLACRTREETSRMVLGILVDTVREKKLSQALADSDGLCLPHLSQALEAARHPQARQVLLEISRGKLEDLRGELAEFIRKNDYRFRDEGFGKEGDAWRRVIGLATGEKPENK